MCCTCGNGLPANAVGIPNADRVFLLVGNVDASPETCSLTVARLPLRVSITCPDAAPAGVFIGTGRSLAWYEWDDAADAAPGKASPMPAMPSAATGTAHRSDF